jgi:hypothetical protein
MAIPFNVQRGSTSGRRRVRGGGLLGWSVAMVTPSGHRKSSRGRGAPTTGGTALGGVRGAGSIRN